MNLDDGYKYFNVFIDEKYLNPDIHQHWRRKIDTPSWRVKLSRSDVPKVLFDLISCPCISHMKSFEREFDENNDILNEWVDKAYSYKGITGRIFNRVTEPFRVYRMHELAQAILRLNVHIYLEAASKGTIDLEKFSDLLRFYSIDEKSSPIDVIIESIGSDAIRECNPNQNIPNYDEQDFGVIDSEKLV